LIIDYIDYNSGCVYVKPGAGTSGAGRQTGQTSAGRVDRTQKLFTKYSGGDDEMDAGEFAESLKEILGKGVYHGRISSEPHQFKCLL